MAGVVVGVHRTTDSTTSIRWASNEAELRGLALNMVHAWSEPVDISITLSPRSLPDLHGDATSTAVQGLPVDALLAQEPEMLVLGAHAGSRHLSHLARSCLQRTTCPVVIVPDGARPTSGRIVVGVRYGDTSRDALRWAADEAHRRHARLVVVHAWQLHATGATDLLRPSRAITAHRGAAHDQLHTWVSDILGNTDTEVHAVHGGPLDVLLHAIADADLVVLGRGTHTALGSMGHDTVGNDLISLTPCPMAFIHRPRPWPGPQI